MDRPLLVLAGGFGTRLRSTVHSVPKPLAPAGGAPFLLHLLENWAAQGVRRFIFLLHHQAAVIEDFLGQQSRHGSLRGRSVVIIREVAPLGTGGAVANAVREAAISESFLVANADTWLGSGVGEVAAAIAPSLAAVRVENSERYGSVQLEGDRVVSFTEKAESRGPGWINAGLYHLPAAPFAAWDGRAFSLETELLPSWAAAGDLRAVAVNTSFIDIGIPEDYFRFDRWAQGGKARSL